VAAIIAHNRFGIVTATRVAVDGYYLMRSPHTVDERLQVETLGGLTLWLAKSPHVALAEPVHPLHFDARSASALLVYLACQARLLARESIAEFFWPDRSQEQARTNLRVALHRLRQQLDPYLLITRQSVAIDRSSSVSVDCRAFEDHLVAGRLAQAVALYKGDFLAGFFLDNSPAFEQWALLERERLRTLAISAYQQLVMQTTANSQLELAIGYAQRLLDLDPLHEPTYRQLMRLLAQAGQRTAALSQYAICDQILHAELDVPPDESTTALYEQIRTGALDKEQEKPGDYRPATLDKLNSRVISSRHTLPPQSTRLIGREAELRQIADLLSNPDCRLLSLLGMGGIGKTRLAIEAAAQQASHFDGGICFIPLAPVETVDLMLVAIAQGLGLQTTSDDLQAQVIGYLRPHRLILLLDNLEHLLDTVDFIAALLHGAPNVKVLVTSRERLYLREEWLLPITGLTLAEGPASEAGQLFLRSAQRVHPGFSPVGHEAAIAMICRQVEGMPLALELAASWVRVMPCEEIARQIIRNPDLLTASTRDWPDRHRSLRSLFDQSWRLLSPSEQSALRRVSVFQGGWTAQEAEAIAGASLPILLSLVDKSLVCADGQGRFSLHELVRQYASEQLHASGEGDRIRQRHFTVYLELCHTGDHKVRGPAAGVWFARLEAEQDNLRASWQWALDTHHFVNAAWLGVALCHVWHVRGHWHEAVKWLEQLLPHCHEFPPDLRLATLLSLFRFWRTLASHFKLARYVDEVMQLQELSTHKLLQAAAWFYAAASTADLAQAADGFEKAISLARAAEDEPKLGSEFGFFADRSHFLAMVLFRYAYRLRNTLGDSVLATQLCTESVQLFRLLGNRDLIAYALGNLGRLALLRGDLAQAHTLLDEAVTIAASIGNRMALSEWQPRLGMVVFYAGDAAAARMLLNESLDLCIHLGNPEVRALPCAYLAEMALAENALGQAEQWLAQSLTYQVAPDWLAPETVDLIWLVARLATERQQYQRAATLFGLAERVGRQIQYVYAGPTRSQVEAALATVHEKFDAALFVKAFSAGYQLSLAEAFATILVSYPLTRSS
jgi:predicted ATPase/DNA-binding SARP family transcriptional activator